MIPIIPIIANAIIGAAVFTTIKYGVDKTIKRLRKQKRIRKVKS